ncbi:hypothetical protein GCM10007854_03030 [Algimonas porphyrae]|uniref:Uncharacterized protein n=1 Tax=Algimonas porphyrae TaxID=1128113 RepID=A0ABQ5UW13_9PROT|nr:hypothetical protein GCM10007854_03030 [Algimonas porphyrae]
MQRILRPAAGSSQLFSEGWKTRVSFRTKGMLKYFETLPLVMITRRRQSEAMVSPASYGNE